MQQSNTFDVPVNRNYIDNWGVTEALRELRANAEDGAKGENEFGMDYDPETKRLVIWNNTDMALTPATLVLGNSIKNSAKGDIGKFGEGYKLALIVLLREGKGVRIINQNEVWTPSFQISETFDTETLHIEVAEGESFNNIIFEIDGVTPEELDLFDAILLSTYMPNMDVIVEVEGKFTVYSHKAASKENRAKLQRLRLELAEMKKFPDADLEMYELAFNEAQALEDESYGARGMFVGGIKINDDSTLYTIDFHPNMVELSRDRDSFENSSDLKSQAISAAIRKDLTDMSKDKIRFIDVEFVKQLTEEERLRLIDDVLAILKLPKGSTHILNIGGSSVIREAALLGIEIPDNAAELEYTVVHTLQALGVRVNAFQHPILTSSASKVVEDIIAENRAILMREGNESLLRMMETIKAVTGSGWRSF